MGRHRAKGVERSGGRRGHGHGGGGHGGRGAWGERVARSAVGECRAGTKQEDANGIDIVKLTSGIAKGSKGKLQVKSCKRPGEEGWVSFSSKKQKLKSYLDRGIALVFVFKLLSGATVFGVVPPGSSVTWCDVYYLERSTDDFITMLGAGGCSFCSCASELRAAVEKLKF